MRILIVAASSLLIAGCSTTQIDPRFSFAKYEGQQRLWEIDSPTFAVSVVNGIEYYTGEDVPSKWYIIVGRIYGATPDGIKVAHNEIAALAKLHGGVGFIEGNTQNALGGRVIGIEGNVFKYVPASILGEPEFKENMAAIAWCLENRNGGIIDGEPVDEKMVTKTFEHFSQKAADRLDTYYKTGR